MKIIDRSRVHKHGRQGWITLAFSVFWSIQTSTVVTADSAYAATNPTPTVSPTSAPTAKRRHKTDSFRLPVFEKPSNPHSTEMSPDAVQLAATLGLTEKLARLKELQKQAQQQSPLPMDLRQDITETRLEILELIEQARLDIDFVAAEIEEEQASIEEVLRWYISERDERVNRANRHAFRTNGVLWAAAEAIAIPTYKYPRLSVPSGVLGIVAGLVPCMFSEIAMRSGGGRHHDRKAYPNMLCKFYDLPTTPRTEYPQSIWMHLNSPPCGADKRSRREILMDHWIDNQNIQTLKYGISDEKIKRISGVDQTDISIELLNDRASMLRELKACVLQMTRPLMEINMCLRDKKQVSARLIGTTETDLPSTQ